MATLSIRLFGQFSVQQGTKILEGFESRKVQELFAYLLLYRERIHSREALASLLWGECSTAQSRTYLRKTLWQLQTALEAQAGTASGALLQVMTDWVQLTMPADLWLALTLASLLMNIDADLMQPPHLGL